MSVPEQQSATSSQITKNTPTKQRHRMRSFRRAIRLRAFQVEIVRRSLNEEQIYLNKEVETYYELLNSINREISKKILFKPLYYQKQDLIRSIIESNEQLCRILRKIWFCRYKSKRFTELTSWSERIRRCLHSGKRKLDNWITIQRANHCPLIHAANYSCVICILPGVINNNNGGQAGGR